MKKRNVLLVSGKYPPDYTGSGLRLHRTYKRLIKKYDINYFVLAGTKNNVFYVRKEITASIPVYRMKYNFFPVAKCKRILKLFLFGYVFFQRLFFFIKVGIFILTNKKQIDVIHTGQSNSWIYLISVLYGKLLNKKIIVETVVRGDPKTIIESDWYIIKKKLFLHAFKNANYIIINSPKLKKRYDFMKNNRAKIWLRPNPVNGNEFFPVSGQEKEKIKNGLGLPDDRKILLSVGRICPNKNHLFAAKSLANVKFPFFWIVLGPLAKEDKGYYKKIMSFISENNLKENVYFSCSYTKNIDKYMKCSDLFIHASKYESGPTNVLLEAWHSGIPAVVKDIPGAYEFVFKEDAFGGLLDKNCNHNEFALAINKYSKKDPGRDEIARLARKHFDHKKLDKKYWEIISE